MAATYRAGYRAALGTSFATVNDVKKDKVFPWALLRKTGEDENLEANRFFYFAAVHSIYGGGFQTGTSQGDRYLYNGETLRGVAKKLKDWGMKDARPYEPTSSTCDNNTTCKSYTTMTAAGNDKTLDYIFTRHKVSVPETVGTFKTVADGQYISDHHMIAARVKFQ
jgi:hypothetical protein